MNNRFITAAIAGLAATGFSGTVSADDVASFYKGKTVSIITIASGSTYDIYSRILADYIGKHIPGNPNVVVKNMPGAGGIRPAHFMWGKAPKDGTHLANLNQTLPIAQIIRPKKVKFNMAAFNWVGRISDLTSTLTVWSNLPAKSVADVKNQEVVVGAGGKGSGTYQIPTMLNQVLGTKFKVISGYKGIKRIDLSMQNGEVQGRYGSLLSWQVNHPDWVGAGRLRHLLQVTTRKTPELSGVPTLVDLATSDEQREVFTFISTQAAIARTVFTTRGVPKARLAALRSAFDRAVADKDFLARAAKAKLPVNPLPGAEVQDLYRQALNISGPMAAKVRKYLGVGGKKKK